MHQIINFYLFILFFAPNFAEKLRYVQIIWRHGDRAPLEKPYPGDLNGESKWARGWGQLTNDGMRQMEELGQFLRERYAAANFLPQHFDRKEIIHNLPQPKWVHKKWEEFGNKTTIELIMEIRQKSWLPYFNGNEEIIRLNGVMQ